MKLKKKSVVAVLTLSMSMGSVLSMVPVFAETSQQNLALNKTAYVSAEYGTMPRKNLTDGNEKTRWSTESGPTQWAYIDLGQEYEMNKFQMFWENESTYASAYNIYVSNDLNSWGEPVLSRTDNKNVVSEELLGSKVSGRYVKLEVTEMKGYPNVSCYEFKIFNTVESCGSDVPFSILEITGCLIPLIASSCFCVIPFSSLAFIISLMIATRTSLSAISSDVNNCFSSSSHEEPFGLIFDLLIFITPL